MVAQLVKGFDKEKNNECHINNICKTSQIYAKLFFFKIIFCSI